MHFQLIVLPLLLSSACGENLPFRRHGENVIEATRSCGEHRNQCDTCCATKHRYGWCCDFRLGVCCPNGISCCPRGYKCTQSGCVRRKPTAALTQASLDGRNYVCPDGAICDDTSTCCIMQTGNYACCPYTYGTCCEDRIHCCPYGYICTACPLRCIQSLSVYRPRGRKLVTSVNLIRCGDRLTSCPSSSTCCPMDKGYGCCPHTKAVCCSDRVHCCPDGYTCDLINLSCEKAYHRILFFNPNKVGTTK